MSNPNVYDFSEPDEEPITIIFPGGEHSCELPTAEELTMPAFQFIAANGEEWYRLFETPELNAKQRKRFDHLNNHLAYALCSDVPRNVVDTLSPKRKAKIIVGFMTASPELLEMARQAMEAQEKPESKQPATAR